MNSLLLTGGRVIDPANRVDAVADLLHHARATRGELFLRQRIGEQRLGENGRGQPRKYDEQRGGKKKAFHALKANPHAQAGARAG